MKNLFLLFSVFFTISLSKAQDLYLTDGNGETVGDIFYSNESNGIFISGCTGTSLFNPLNLYIIPNTGAVALNGDTLIDFFDGRNTIASFQFCGGIIDLLIHSINPDDPSSFVPGKYDVVLDMDQDAHYNPTIDVLLGPSMDEYFFEIVDIPHDTTISYPVNKTVLASKSFAFRESHRLNKVTDTTYYALFKKNLAFINRINNFDFKDELANLNLLEDIENLVLENRETMAVAYQDGASNVLVKTAASFLLSGDALGNFGGPIAEKLGLDYQSLVITNVLGKVRHAINASRNMYLDIAADPPRTDYHILEDIIPNIDYDNDLKGVDFFFKSDKSAIELYQLFELEYETDKAYLTTLERLQGAKINNEYDYMRFQNQHLKNIVSLLLDVKIAKKKVINAYKMATRVGTPIRKDSIQQKINNIRTNGFAPSLIADALDRGLSITTINELKTQVIDFDTAKITTGTQWEDSILLGLDLSIADLQSVMLNIDSLEQLFTQNNIAFPLPVASISGIDSAVVGQNFMLTNIFENSLTAPIQHWKPNHTFGNTTTIQEQIPGYYLYQVTNKDENGGVLNRAFKLVHIKLPNTTIPFYLDSTNFYKIYERDTLRLKTQQNSSDANGLNITWYDNDNVISGANQNSLPYVARSIHSLQPEFHLIRVEVKHPSFPQLVRAQTWLVKVLPDSLHILTISDSIINSNNYSTGANGSGGFLPNGSRDLNWTFSTGNTKNEAINGVFDSAFVTGQAHGNWMVPNIAANWISSTPTGISNGFLYQCYKCHINLPDSACGQSFADNFVLNLDFAWDDFLDDIYINGVPQTSYTQSLTQSGYSAVTSISLPNNWHAGDNELVILINDAGQVVTGLLAQIPTTNPLLSSCQVDLNIRASASNFCTDNIITITVDSVANAQYKWYRNGVLIPMFTSRSITVTQSGNYTVGVFINANFIVESDILFLDSCNQCTGTFGDPIINTTFGTGPIVDLPTAVPSASTTYGYNPTCPENGLYCIADTTNQFCSLRFLASGDHTGNNKGRMMIMNADANQAGEFYRQKMNGLCAGTTYQLAAWFTNIIRPDFCIPIIPPNVKFEVLDAQTLVSLGFVNTGNLPIFDSINWQQYHLEFTATSDSVILLLKNNGLGGCGNDLAIDDITLRACSGGRSLSISAENTEICLGSSVTLNGNINSNDAVDFQWQKSTNNGTTWQDISGANDINYTIDNFTTNDIAEYRLSAATAGNIGSVNCRFVSGSNGIQLHRIDLPIANFTAQLTNATITLNNTSQLATQYVWSFGDGTTDTSKNIIHTYAQDGDYTIVVQAYNSCGEVDTQSIIITVCSRSPQIEVLGLARFCDSTGAILRLNTCKSGTIRWYKNNTLIPNENKDSLKVNTSGTYRSEVIYNGTTLVSNSIDIHSLMAPNADFNFVQNNNTIELNNQSTNATTYHWDFGDNASTNNNNPSHTYSQTGTYSILLQSVNEICLDTVSKVISIQIISGIKNNSNMQISIYPNPTKGIIHIDLEKINGDKNIQLFNLLGDVILQQKINANESTTTLDLSHLPKASYLLQIQTATNEIQTYKVVVQ